MNPDRRIELHVAVPEFEDQRFAAPTRHEGQPSKRPPDAQLQQQFEQLLTNASPDSSQESGAGAASQTGAFSLFTGLSAQTQPGSAPPASPDLYRAVDSGIERLMVDNGQHGQRQVRMEFKEDTLPGVSVVIQEQEGRLQVDFICSVESSRLRLGRAAPVQAQTLANRLRRDVLFRVQTDDDEDPCLQETLARP